MIPQAFSFICFALNQFVVNRFGADEDMAIVNNVVEKEGDISPENHNKLILSLINIEHQTSKAFMVNSNKVQGGSYTSFSPSQHFNLDIMVTSIFEDYSESLKFINAALLFFQIHPTFNSTLFSSFPKGLERLDFNIEQIDYKDMHNLWSALGGKYRPSVIYKTRLITVQGNETQGFDKSIHNLSTHVN